MADTTKPASELRIVKDRSARFIYFDQPSAYGEFNGVIQVELVSNILTPTQDGGTGVGVVVTGHLRCSAAGARSLRDALDAALGMIDQPGRKPAGEGTSTTFN